MTKYKKFGISEHVAYGARETKPPIQPYSVTYSMISTKKKSLTHGILPYWALQNGFLSLSMNTLLLLLFCSISSLNVTSNPIEIVASLLNLLFFGAITAFDYAYCAFQQ